jgi:cell division protein FtsQ
MAAEIRKFGKPTNQTIPVTNINVFPANATSQDYQGNRHLKRQQKAEQFGQNLWRAFTVLGLAALVGWGATLPDWNLRSANQIKIKGHQLLSSQAIKKMVPITFPQSIFKVQPQAIAAQIEKNAPVKQVKVERTLFPAEIVISLTERKPIAQLNYKGTIGLVDSEGKLLPSQAYSASMPKPDLLLLANNQSLIARDWQTLYQSISRYSIAIATIDWREPNNLIVTTKLGKVHFGVYAKSKFEKQMSILNQILTATFEQSLAEAKIDKISYIDLSDPQHPLIERR